MGIIEKTMETTIVYWGYIGIMENRMEAAIMGLGFKAEGSGLGHTASQG